MKFEPFQALKFPNKEKKILIYLEAKKMERILVPISCNQEAAFNFFLFLMTGFSSHQF
jgi:hypothetical protein